MQKNNAAFIISLLFLGGIAFFPLALPNAFRIDEAVNPKFVTFPKNLADWQGIDESLDRRTYEILETKNILSRTYKKANGASVHLLLVGSHRDRRVAHPPEVCYSGSHFSVVEKKESQLSINGIDFRVKEFTARSEKKDAPLQHVLYFYKIGKKFTPNYYEQQLRFMMDKLTGKETEVLLIRLASKDSAVFSDLLPLVLKSLD